MVEDEGIPLESLSHTAPRPGFFEVSSENGKFNITNLTVSTSIERDAPNATARPPARWKSPEFIIYYIVFAAAVPLMIWTPMRLSESSHPNYQFYQHLLSKGWIPGRRLDNTDRQYRSFRDNLPALLLLSTLFLALSKAYRQIFVKPDAAAQSGRVGRLPFLALFSVAMVAGLHGTSILKILFILTVNYGIAKFTRASAVGPVLTWAFNIAMLFANEIQDGYRFEALHNGLDVLDRYQGFYPRWHISFNITMLRLVSFNMDYYWACRENQSPTNIDTSTLGSAKSRSTTPNPVGLYSFANYIAYTLYPPLYFAGPIMTFDDFMWQLRRPVDISPKTVVTYAIRFIFCFLTMEFIQHYIYVVAIKEAVAWRGDSPLELSMVGFWNLIHVWLKLLIPWRFFRLWALADGIDPPENMVRCMANNYSTMGFWRSWHRSYNLWLLRYIYIPLGGMKNVFLSTILVFTFVALWHDLSFRLLTWGWLVSLFIIPELSARQLLPPQKYGHLWWYRHVCAIGGVFNVLMMMTANLIGFVVGVDGIKYLGSQLVDSWNGFRFMLVACTCLFVGVQVMFEYREEEMRKGVHRKC